MMRELVLFNTIEDIKKFIHDQGYTYIHQLYNQNEMVLPGVYLPILSEEQFKPYGINFEYVDKPCSLEELLNKHNPWSGVGHIRGKHKSVNINPSSEVRRCINSVIQSGGIHPNFHMFYTRRTGSDIADET